MAKAMLSKHVALLLVVALIICSGEAYKSKKSSRKSKKGGGGSSANLQRIYSCRLRGGLDCVSYGGEPVICVYPDRLCNGYPDCPLGEDEYIGCNFGIGGGGGGGGIFPTRTYYRTEVCTSTETTAATSTTTTSFTSSTTTTTTSTTTTTTTSTRSLGIIIPFKAVTTTYVTTFTSAFTFSSLSLYAAGAPVAVGLTYCDALVAVPGTVTAGTSLVSVGPLNSAFTGTLTGTASCMPSTTLYFFT